MLQLVKEELKEQEVEVVEEEEDPKKLSKNQIKPIKLVHLLIQNKIDQIICNLNKNFIYLITKILGKNNYINICNF
jgi:transcription antitermination factor NusA-like protein